MNCLRQLGVLLGLSFAICSPVSAEWSYETSTDRMTGRENSYAHIKSTNSLDLEFPYKGQNHGTLIVRRHPKHGLDVIFRVEKGQLLCRGYDDSCRVVVKFDAAPPMTFSGDEPADRSTTAIFLRDPKRFISRASTAKTILVQANFYRNGAPILEFRSAAPLKWSGIAPAAAEPAKATRPGKTEPAEGKSADQCSRETASVPVERRQRAMVDCLLGKSAHGAAENCERASLKSDGECGRIYAECHVVARELNQFPAARFMNTCLTSGLSAAQKELEARQEKTGTQWPAPPASLSPPQ